MAIKIRAEKDLGIGAIYLGLGVAGFLIARDYSSGTAARMGPGYLPTIISILLVLFGLITCLRGFRTDGEPIGPINWKGIGLITLSVCSFAFLLERAGLAIALLVMALLSALCSENFRLRPLPILGLALLIGACVLLFVYGLGVPMPLVGDWLRPVFDR